jgi:hypothetical protein
MAPRSVRFGVRTRKLSNIGQSLGWVTKNSLSRAPPCFGRHVDPGCNLQSIAPTNPHWARVVHYGPFSLCTIHKEGSCPNSGHIRIMMKYNTVNVCRMVVLYK